MLRTSITNLILRGLTLGAKLILLLSIARCLTPEKLGVFGIMTATIAIALYFLGMDFYAFNTREILSRPNDTWSALIRDQLVFHGLVYVVVLPVLLSVFLLSVLPWEYVGWFYLLLVLEHLSQETFRLLVTMSRSSMANAVLFLRSGSWIYVVVASWFLHFQERNLTVIWTGWSIGVLVSLGLAAFALRDLPWRQAFSDSINWMWIRKGVKVCLPFLIATLALMGTQYADRYFIQLFHGESMVGVYTFFVSIANVVHVFVFTAFMIVLHPRIVKAYRLNRIDEYKQQMRKLAWCTIISVVALTGIAVIVIRPVLGLVGRSIYVEHLPVFWILLGVVAVLTCSYIPHYALYARMKDRAIIISSLLALAVTLTACGFLVPEHGVYGAATSTLIGMTCLGLSKVLFLLGMRTTSVTLPEHMAQTAEVANRTLQ